MADYKDIQARIKEVIRPNGVGAITAAEHQSLLMQIVNKVENDFSTMKGSAVQKDGIYPEMTVGKSDNLVGRGESIPAEFSFRASGGKSIEDGTARIKTLKGNAVVWNQLYPTDWVRERNGVKSTSVGGIVSVVGTLTESYFDFQAFTDNVANHIYLFEFNAKSSVFNGYSFELLNRNQKSTINNGHAAILHNNTNSSLGTYIGVVMTKGITLNEKVTISQYDLTLMFGAGNEPTTIEEFNARKPIVEDENAYNEGEVIPFTAEGIKSIGDNAWDEEWRNGYYYGGGLFAAASTHVANVNPFKVIPNAEYRMNKYPAYVWFYDKDMQYISFGFVTSAMSFRTPSNAQFVNFSMEPAYGTTYNNDICISLAHSGYKEGQYFPYEQDIRKIDSRILEEFPNGMMPWDKVYNKNGKGYIVKGTGVVDLGTLSYAYQPPIAGSFPLGFFYVDIANKAHGNINMLSGKYDYTADWVNVGIRGDESAKTIYVKDGAFADVASFKSAMQGVMLYYELAEPTIIEYDEPFNLDYLVWDFGTEEIIADKPSAPLKADIIYQFNAVDEIRELRQLIATMQAQLASLTSNNGGQ
jgi:hypothetical protein